VPVPSLAGQCGYVNNKVRSAFAAFVRLPFSFTTCLFVSLLPPVYAGTGGTQVGLPHRRGTKDTRTHSAYIYIYIYTAHARTCTRTHTRTYTRARRRARVWYVQADRDSTVAARCPRGIIYRPAQGIESLTFCVPTTTLLLCRDTR